MLFITTLAIFDESKFPAGAHRIHCKFVEGFRATRMLKDISKMFSEADFRFLQTECADVTLVDKSTALYNALLTNFPNLRITQDYDSYAPKYILEITNRNNFVMPIASDCAAASPQTKLPTRIDEGIYLGGIDDALSLRALMRLNIGAIINCTVSLEFPRVDGIEMHRVPVNDVVSESITQFFDETSELITRLRREKKIILIHCAAGVSRSPTILAAHLMKTRGMNWLDAVHFIRELRPCVEPNLGFAIQLEKYGEALACKKS